MLSPLSGSQNCLLIKEVKASCISARWRDELGLDWSPPCVSSVIQYWLDKDTGLYFYSPAEMAGEASLYKQLQCFPWYYMESKWEFSEAVSILKSRTCLGESRILEVGVGAGHFLEQARAVGFDVTGIELNPDGAASARAKGFTVFEQDLAALKTENLDYWDAICSFQVLEHLPNPRQFLEQCLELLKPGGLLILSVPNAAVTRHLDPIRNDLLDQPPHHMSHWDQGVFRSLESLLQIKLINVRFEPLATYHFNWFFGSLSRVLRSKVGTLGSKAVLNRFTLPLTRKILEMGFSRLVKGHTLLVCLEKQSGG